MAEPAPRKIHPEAKSHAKPTAKHKAKRKPKPKKLGAKPGRVKFQTLPPASDEKAWATPEVVSAAEHAEKRDEQSASEHAEDEAHEENPVLEGLGYLEDAHIVGEGWFGRETAGKSLRGLCHAVAEEGDNFWVGEGAASESAFYGAGPVASGLSIVGGMMEIAEGAAEYKHDRAGGTTAMLGGTSSVVSGGAGIAALAGGGVAPLVATGAAAFGAGLKVGRFGNEQTKEQGWLKNGDGEAASPSEWLTESGGAVDDWVTSHSGNSTLGRALGYGTMTLLLPGAGAMAATGAIAAPVVKGAHALEAAGHSLGKHAANEKRADQYAGTRDNSLDATDGIAVRNPYTGQITIAQRGTADAVAGGQQMADYDDDRDAAIERSKTLHPEKWGLGPNALSQFNAIAEEMAKGTHGK